MDKKAVVLLSGGLDSATAAAVAKNQGYGLIALSFSYGQKHLVELESARKVAKHLGVLDHREVEIPSHLFTSALTRDDIPVPKNRDIDDEIPDTYVPGRNILFLSFALSLAESLQCSAIYIGANAVDYSGYPDCRPDFFQAYRSIIAAGTKTGVQGEPILLEVPLLMLKKEEIITLGTDLGVDYSLTHSCYAPDSEGRSCGTCDSCKIRREGFARAGVPDPTVYQ
jgi:7-cyano-7-deazaguanine synthase